MTGARSRVEQRPWGCPKSRRTATPGSARSARVLTARSTAAQTLMNRLHLGSCGCSVAASRKGGHHMGLLSRLESRNLRSAENVIRDSGFVGENALAMLPVKPLIDASAPEFSPTLLSLIGGAGLVASKRGLYLIRGGRVFVFVAYAWVEDFELTGRSIVVDKIKIVREGQRRRIWMESDQRTTESFGEVVTRQLLTYHDLELEYNRPPGDKGTVRRQAWRPGIPAGVNFSLGGLWSPSAEELAGAAKLAAQEAESARHA